MIKELQNGEPCEHKGCLHHITHPCEGCGRIGGRNMKYKAKVTASVEMIVWINESLNGDIEIDDIDEITDVQEFEVKYKI